MAVPVQDGSVATYGNPDNNNHLVTPDIAHTINTGLTDSVLLVMAMSFQFANNPPVAATWDGVTMRGASWSSGFPGAAFWMYNPPSGTKNVKVFWNVIYNHVAVTCVTFTGVAGVLFDPSFTATGTDNSPTLTFPSSGIDSLAVSQVFIDLNRTIAMGGAETQISNFNTGGSVLYRGASNYIAAAAPGANTTLSYSTTLTPDWTVSGLLLASSTRHSIPQQLIM